MTRNPLVAWIDGIGLRGPGLAGWTASRESLAGRIPYTAAKTVVTAPQSLPPAERRRVGVSVKLAIEVGVEAAAHAGRDATTMPSVFTSSSGDGDNCDAICRSLATDRLISPTRFHNSVHNAPSGYWGIAAHAMAPSTSLCAFDTSFAAGLMEGLAQLAGGEDAVLLVAYDAPYPEPLFAARPTPDAFGVALVLGRARSAHSLARIEIGDDPADGTTRMDDAALEHWRTAIPAARALSLLAALARGDDTATVVIDDANGVALALRVQALPLSLPQGMPCT